VIAAASPLAVLFSTFVSRLGGDAERLAPLEEDAIVRLVEQARAGDVGARRTLYTQHVDWVFRTVRGMLRCDADAEDVTQDALLTVLTSLNIYTPRTGTRFSAWVTTIAVNTVRRRFRRRRPELTATGDLPETPDVAADPADDLDRAWQRRALLTALGELRERERAIVSLRYGAELNASEIAATVGVDPATLRKILERAHAPRRPRRGIVESRWRHVMNDEEFGDAWTTLDPTVHRRRRIDARVRVARSARHASRGPVARAVQGCAVPGARSCHAERGLGRRRATAGLVRACVDVSAESDSCPGTRPDLLTCR